MSHPIVVIVICDGHRPDFVSEETTPHMENLVRGPSRDFSVGDAGVVGVYRHWLLAHVAWTEGQCGGIADRERP